MKLLPELRRRQLFAGLILVLLTSNSRLFSQQKLFDQYFEKKSEFTLSLPANFQVSEARVSPSGKIYLRSIYENAILRFDSGSTDPVRYDLNRAIENMGPSSSLPFLQSDFALDEAGNVYVLGSWKLDRLYHAAIFQYSSSGEFRSRIDLMPPVEASRVGVNADGTFVVLGSDARYFKHQLNQLFIAHLYSNEGTWLRGLVEYATSNNQPGAPGSPNSSSGASMGRELERSVIRRDLAGNLVFTQTYSKGISRLDRSSQARSVRLKPDAQAVGSSASPGPSVATEEILWNIAPARQNFTIAELVRSENQSTNVSIRTRLLRIYDADGNPQSPEMQVSREVGVLIGSDANGSIYFAEHSRPGLQAISKYDLRLK
ncbi:MAG: hypothetical protein WBN92_12345 [Terriglobia bacterium]